MSNKLTKKDFDLLIERVLNEAVTPSPADIADALQVYEDEVAKRTQPFRAKVKAAKVLTKRYPSLSTKDALLLVSNEIAKSPSTTGGGKTGGGTTGTGSTASPFGLDTTKKPPSITSGHQFDYLISSIPPELKKIIIGLFMTKAKALDTSVTDDTGLLTKLASITEDQKKLGWDDFAVILQNPSNALFKPAVLAIQQAINTNPNAQYSKALLDLAKELNLRAKDDPNVSTREVIPQIPTIDIADAYSKDRKTVPSYVVSFFNNLGLSGVSSVSGRIEAINALTEKVINGSFNQNDATLSELMSNIAVAGLLARITKFMDNKAAGWAFEAFLAQLINGTTEGDAMGAADFKFGIPEGTKVAINGAGSAKLMSSEDFTQSWSTISMSMPNETRIRNSNTQLKKYNYAVGGGSTRTPDESEIKWGNNKLAYIVGVKKDTAGATTAKTTDIAQVDIYLILLERKSGTTGRADKSQITGKDHAGTSVTVGDSGSGGMKVDFKAAKPIGTIKFHKDLTKLDQLAKSALDKIDDEVPQLMKAMETFRRKTNSYLASGKVDDMIEATTQYANMFALINNVFGKAPQAGAGVRAAAARSGFEGGVEQTVGDPTKGVQAKAKKSIYTENKKKSKKDLDILIEQVILKRLLEK